VIHLAAIATGAMAGLLYIMFDNIIIALILTYLTCLIAKVMARMEGD
jgi:hypothetical protein